jgi:tRNA A-37 threonylcarbamoyl transferase component Bud32
LKDCVVDAFRKLHERGIVHRDVALRHVALGADTRITLIDFQASRADELNEELGLVMTYSGEKGLEIRHVKFLLNMDNKEFKKSKAALKRSETKGAMAAGTFAARHHHWITVG